MLAPSLTNKNNVCLTTWLQLEMRRRASWTITWQLATYKSVIVLLAVKAEHLYSALHGIQTTLKRSGMDHTVLPAINTMSAFYLVSVHQMAPPPIEVANI